MSQVSSGEKEDEAAAKIALIAEWKEIERNYD
jgi:hypothetical protein